MYNRIVVSCMLSSLCTCLLADTQIDDLSLLLKNATQEVTASKLNIDYTPSVVSILKHDQLNLLGIKTLFEALSLLPGIETSIDHIGTKKVIFRGLDTPNNFTADKAKLIIDGVSIEMGIFGNSSFYLDLPIDIIDRIEILRGPGSALYGTGALTGVINVITTQSKQSSDALFFGAGSDEYLMGGGSKHYTLANNTSLYIDGYYQKHNRQIAVGESYIPGKDKFLDLETGEISDFGRSTKTIESLNDYSLSMALHHESWSFQARLKENKSGNYYGWSENLEKDTDKRTAQRYFFAEIGYKDTLNSDTFIETKLGYSHTKVSMDNQDYVPIRQGLSLPYTFSINESEQRFTLESEIESRSYEEHTIVGGIYLQSLQELDNSINETVSPYGKRALFEEGVKRNVLSAYIRDNVDISNELSVLAALRMDYYTEEEKIYPSAQLGLVYAPEQKWNFKFNYGHAFRVPSWIEQYSIEYGENDGTRPGNPDLVAETIDTFEAVAIYRNANKHHVEANIYYSILNDILDIDDSTEPAGYANHSERNSYGAEAAYTFIPYMQNQFHLNVSYNETEYITPGETIKQSMAGVAKLMIKSYYIHYLTPSLSISALVKYIGERPRHQESDARDENDPIKPYTTCDATINFISSHHWDFHASVKNIFDVEVNYPSYYSRHNGGNIRQGRNVLFQGTYRF